MTVSTSLNDVFAVYYYQYYDYYCHLLVLFSLSLGVINSDTQCCKAAWYCNSPHGLWAQGLIAGYHLTVTPALVEDADEVLDEQKLSNIIDDSS